MDKINCFYEITTETIKKFEIRDILKKYQSFYFSFDKHKPEEALGVFMYLSLVDSFRSFELIHLTPSCRFELLTYACFETQFRLCIGIDDEERALDISERFLEGFAFAIIDEFHIELSPYNDEEENRDYIAKVFNNRYDLYFEEEKKGNDTDEIFSNILMNSIFDEFAIYKSKPIKNKIDSFRETLALKDHLRFLKAMFGMNLFTSKVIDYYGAKRL